MNWVGRFKRWLGQGVELHYGVDPLAMMVNQSCGTCVFWGELDPPQGEGRVGASFGW